MWTDTCDSEEAATGKIICLPLLHWQRTYQIQGNFILFRWNTFTVVRSSEGMFSQRFNNWWWYKSPDVSIVSWKVWKHDYLRYKAAVIPQRRVCFVCAAVCRAFYFLNKNIRIGHLPRGVLHHNKFKMKLRVSFLNIIVENHDLPMTRVFKIIFLKFSTRFSGPTNCPIFSFEKLIGFTVLVLLSDANA